MTPRKTLALRMWRHLWVQNESEEGLSWETPSKHTRRTLGEKALMQTLPQPMR